MDDSDADGDGNSALMEFLTGSKPDSPNSAFRPLPHIISAGSQYLAISCRNAPISPGTRDFLRVEYHYTE